MQSKKFNFRCLTSHLKVLNEYPEKKKRVIISLMISGPVLLFIFLGYIIQFHGMSSLFEWVSIIRNFVILVVIVGILNLLGFFLWLDNYVANNPKRMKWIKGKMHGEHAPSRALWAILLMGLILPLSLFSWIGIASIQKGDKSPQLLLSNVIGIHGVPDLGVSFWTDKPIKTSIQWGYQGSGSAFTIEEIEESQSHVFMLEDLMANESCWFMLEYSPFSQINYTFKTPNNQTNILKFAVASDPHIGSSSSNETQTIKILENIVAEENQNDLFFLTGDIVDLGFEDSQWKHAIDVLTNYTTKIPIRTCVGNHDAMIKGVEFYKDYFYPEGLSLTDDGSTSLYQYFKMNGINFFILDLEWGTSETFGEGSAQREWFIDTLENIDKDEWTIVMSHSYYYASGSNEFGSEWYDNPQTIETLVPLFEEYDVDLVFSGHVHQMSHLTKNNVSYSTIGAMGTYFDKDPEIESVADVHYFNNEFPGHIETSINGNNAILTYYDENRIVNYSTIIYK